MQSFRHAFRHVLRHNIHFRKHIRKSPSIFFMFTTLTSGQIDAVVATNQSSLIDDVYCRDVSAFEAILQSSTDKFHYSAVDIESLLSYIASMENHGLKPTLSIINSVIKAYACSGAKREALDWFNKIAEFQLTASTDTYNWVIEAHAQDGDAVGASLWLDEMEELGLEVTTDSINSVMSAYATTNDKDGALSYYRSLEARGLAPNQTTFTTLAYTYASHNDRGNAARAIDKMLEIGLQVMLLSIQWCESLKSALNISIILFPFISIPECTVSHIFCLLLRFFSFRSYITKHNITSHRVTSPQTMMARQAEPRRLDQCNISARSSGGQRRSCQVVRQNLRIKHGAEC